MSTVAFSTNMASQVEHKIELQFNNKYKMIEEIGKGRGSTIFLFENDQKERVIVKKYAIEAGDCDLFKTNKIAAEAYIRVLAQKEFDIGQRIDHPNIVEIKEVYFENPFAYIVMNYVEGRTLEECSQSSVREKCEIMDQFLNVVEHLLLRNVFVNNIGPKDFLISNGNRLTLINLDCCKLIQKSAGVTLQHFINKIESLLFQMGGDLASKAIDDSKKLISSKRREEKIQSDHTEKLITWIESLRKAFRTPLHLNTVHAQSANHVLESYNRLRVEHSDYIAFNTSQHSKFLAYSLFASAIIKQFNPGRYPQTLLQNTHLIRYPFPNLPTNLEDLFKKYPLSDDYDTVSSEVANALLSGSPSLNENESEESAWGIFENNERGETDVAQYIYEIFESEGVSESLFKDDVKNIVKDKASKSKQGLIYTYFIPKTDPLNKAVYLSEKYGIPSGNPHAENTVTDFYQNYEQGEIVRDNSQLRLLFPALADSKNGFDLNQIKSYRFTTLSEKELKNYSEKIEKLVSKIFEDHIKKMLKLTQLAAETEVLEDESKQQKGFQKLCYKHLCRRDIKLALYYWNKLDEKNENRFSFLPGIIACLLKKGQFEQAFDYFEKFGDKILFQEQLAARFALYAIGKNDLSLLQSMLLKLSGSNLKNFVLLIASNKFTEYQQDGLDEEEMEGLMSESELIKIAS